MEGTMKKEYQTPWAQPVLMTEPARPLCSSELKPLEEGGDLGDLGWITNVIMIEP